jgi:outer membrane protein OmpA-like peptidoglycan-associated protein
MNSIHFDFGKSTLNPDCYSELNYLAQFLKHNLSKQVEITGHTDNIGPKDYNLLLSQSRAEAVVNYLVNKGVNKEQLVAKSYGAQRPIDTNSTALGKAKNRRVELTVQEKVAFASDLLVTPKKILFNFNKTIFNPEYRSELNDVAEFFRHNSSARVEIAGYTDDTGPEDYNYFLSQARAQAVANYLKNQGVNKEHIVAKGYGEKKPIDSNSTSAGKARNRRVEIILLNQ